MATNILTDRPRTLRYTNATSDAFAVNAAVPIGVILGVALVAIAVGSTGAVLVRGIATLAKKAAQAFSQGAQLYWDATNEELTTTADSHIKAGVAADAADASDTTANVLLNVNG